jgi:hypothetical protein
MQRCKPPTKLNGYEPLVMRWQHNYVGGLTAPTRRTRTTKPWQTGWRFAVHDDIINQLAYYITNEDRMPAGLARTIIEEIERLRYQIERLDVALDDISHLTTDRQVQHRIREARRG